MYQDIIDKINPAPKFNLKWYKDEDKYSDGDIEDFIIRLIAGNQGEEYTQVIADNFSWPVYYYLTHMRKNILNWYPFEKESTVLEIGCGLGAITDMFCEKCGHVTAVELSKRRATAALLRCREKKNLEIIVGNLNDIQFEDKFDYITLIGVLEYQGTFTDSDRPYVDFLKKVRGLLKPGGKLLIGIENKYGLKYWCGAGEDHSGIPFDGINQYNIGNGKAQTFSRSELEQLIVESGFVNHYFYYPLPDYKLPSVIYSEENLPQKGDAAGIPFYYIPNGNSLVIEERKVYDDLIDNGMFEFFANSFLVECGDAESKCGQIQYASVRSERSPEYRVVTKLEKNRVIKSALDESAGRRHIEDLKLNEERLERHGINVVKSIVEKGQMIYDRIKEDTLENIFIAAYKNKDIKKIETLYEAIYQEILKSSDIVENGNIIYSLGLGNEDEGISYGAILAEGNLDMIARNCFCCKDGLYWYDQEWCYVNVPVNYIMFRNIAEMYTSYPWMHHVLDAQLLFARYGIGAAKDKYMQLDMVFKCSVGDMKQGTLSARIIGNNEGVYVKNIEKLLQGNQV